MSLFMDGVGAGCVLLGMGRSPRDCLGFVRSFHVHIRIGEVIGLGF